MAHPGSWNIPGTNIALPDFGVSEGIGNLIGAPQTPQGGSNIFPNQPSTPIDTGPIMSPAPISSPIKDITPSTGGSGGGGGSQPSAPSGGKGISHDEAIARGWDVNNLPSGYFIIGSGGSQVDPNAKVRDELSGAYDAYFKSLDDMMGGLGGQQNNQNQLVENQFNQGMTDLTGQKNMGMTDLAGQRTKNQAQQVKSLRDIADNIRNLFQTGNVMLGSRGAGDSSAANQYAYAVTKVGSKERGNVMEQTRSIENDIAGRESRLNEIYTTETARLKTERDNNILNIANQFEQARQQLLQAKAQGQLEKGVSLANLSRELLNQATQRMMQIDADIRNRASMLDQWAMNNSKTIGELRNNMAQVGAFKAPNVQANAIMGTPQFDSMGNMQTSLRPAVGYSTKTEEKQPTSLLGMGSYLPSV